MINVRKVRITFLIFFSMMFTMIPAFITEAEDASRIIVSMGDSFSSGEGIEPFYDENLSIYLKVKSHDWLSHRSEKSWGGQLTLPGVDGTMSEHRGTHWFFSAVSGAETKHITKESQNKDYSLCTDLRGESRMQGTELIPPQISIFQIVKEKLGDVKIDYVTLTLGGNDAGFTDIIITAATSSTYINPSGLVDKLNDAFLDFYKEGGIRDDLRQAYKDIEESAGSQAAIIVAGYPQLLNQYQKEIFFNYAETEVINSAVSRFNEEIEKLVLSCKVSGMNIHFVSVEEEFRGHEAYSEKPYINSVMSGSQSQELKDNLSLLEGSAYSIHPNEKGAKVYAQCVQAKIDELEGVSDNSQKFSTDTKVSVLDQQGNFYEDCTINVSGKKNLWLWFTEDVQMTYEGSDHAIPLNLEQGTYTITVTDNKDEANYYSKLIEVSEEHTQKQLVFDTNFGYAQEDALVVPITEDDTVRNDTIDLQEHIPTDAVEFNGHYYHVYELEAVNSQAEAAAYCKNQGGYLATITSQEENDFLYSYIMQEGYASAYFGLSDAVSEGDWIWNNGEEVIYTNWHNGEPNGENPNEDYAMFYYKYSDGTWNDGDLGGRTVKGGKAFICEWGEYQEVKSESWKVAYRAYIEERRRENDNMKEEWNYKLVHVDNDGIPELYINFQSTAGGDVLCSFQNGALIEQAMWNYGFSYIERKNLFRDSGGHMDEYYDSIYSIIDGKFVLLAKGEFGAEDNSNVQYDAQGFPIYEYYWNGERVASELLYEQSLYGTYALDQKTDPYDGAVWDEHAGRYKGNGICDYDEILEMINNYEFL